MSFPSSYCLIGQKIQNPHRDESPSVSAVNYTRMSSLSLRRQRDAPGVGDLPLLQVLHQLCQPALGGGVVLQHLGEGAVLQLVRQALTQGFSGSGERTPHISQVNVSIREETAPGVGRLTTGSSR